jgi:hypothetical protein
MLSMPSKAPTRKWYGRITDQYVTPGVTFIPVPKDAQGMPLSYDAYKEQQEHQASCIVCDMRRDALLDAAGKEIE